MRIARFNSGGKVIVGVDNGEGYLDFSAILDAKGFGTEPRRDEAESQFIRYLRQGFFASEFLLEQTEWALHSTQDFRLKTDGLTPQIPYSPTKIICIARNYSEHAKEGGADVPERPIFFAKTENCAIGPGMPIRIPTDVGRVDHEGELGVVISLTAEKVKAEDASRYILGYTVVNDVTARELQKSLGARGLPWYQAKSRDTFAPFGPAIVTADEIKEIDGRFVRVWVNGQIKQDGNTADMVFKVPALIEEISSIVTLHPGDIIATGTPSGVGKIEPGDEVVVEVEGIGRLSNPVEAV